MGEPDVTTWQPVLKNSDSTVTTEKITLDRQHELMIQMEYDVCLKRKELYDQNLHKAYEESWERCATAMKAKLEARTTFVSNMCNDPVTLIKATKEHSLCFEESRYEMAKISDGIRNCINFKQKEQGKEVC